MPIDEMRIVIDRFYVVFKWLNMPVVVPSSWSILNKKTGRVNVIPQKPQRWK